MTNDEALLIKSMGMLDDAQQHRAILLRSFIQDFGPLTEAATFEVRKGF